MSKNSGPVITIGNFDGVHRGHGVLLSKVKKEAAKRNVKSLVVTFTPHPQCFINPDKYFKLLSIDIEKNLLLKQFGLDEIVFLPFTEQLKKTSAKDFFENIILKQLKPSMVILGYDSGFGKDRLGDFSSAKKYLETQGVVVENILRVDNDETVISSTIIRKYLDNGEFKKAINFLGDSYLISGKVVHGDAKGTEIGFPTINLNIDESKKLPLNGIYFGKVEIDNKEYHSLIYIGTRPTLNGLENRVEANLLNFSGNLYGKTANLYLQEFIREEIKFKTIEDLKDAINKDKEKALKIIKINNTQTN